MKQTPNPRNSRGRLLNVQFEDYGSKQSRYLMPEPVLKMTTRSPMSILPAARRDFSAGKQAGPSGVMNRPSLDQTSRPILIMSSSSTATAPPFDSRKILSIRKSP